ncbi:MAG: hypothetical protein CMK07_00505, partial [Ponticaulis sp.]|nr:hypothetical protein [Ponticaulis sp.]
SEAQIDGFSDAATDQKHVPSDWSDQFSHPAYTVVASSADRRIELLENGRLIAASTLSITGSSRLGEHVLMLDKTQEGDLVWKIIVDAAGSLAGASTLSTIFRIRGDEAFTQSLVRRQEVGMTLVITDYSISPETRSDPGFTIMTS